MFLVACSAFLWRFQLKKMWWIIFIHFSYIITTFGTKRRKILFFMMHFYRSLESSRELALRNTVNVWDHMSRVTSRYLEQFGWSACGSPTLIVKATLTGAHLTLSIFILLYIGWNVKGAVSRNLSKCKQWNLRHPRRRFCLVMQRSFPGEEGGEERCVTRHVTCVSVSAVFVSSRNAPSREKREGRSAAWLDTWLASLSQPFLSRHATLLPGRRGRGGALRD